MATSIFACPFYFGLVTFFALATVLLKWLHSVQPKPYMDEIFHIPQAQHYCDGNFSHWDPMITTLPGLYLSSSLPLSIPGRLLFNKGDMFCTPYILRCTNLFFSTGNVALIFLLLNRMHPKMSSSYTFLVASTLGSFPMLYFFTFLYYTDAGSTFFTLLMYLLHLHHQTIPAALIGVIAILFRQTNIIWVVFMVGVSAQHTLLQWMAVQKKNLKTQRKHDWLLLHTFFNLFSVNLQRNPWVIVELVLSILMKTWCYIIVTLLFLLFVYINNGIVVGDRSHHEVTFNFPQIYYFLSTVLFFASPHLISFQKIYNWLSQSIQKPISFITFSVISALLIAKFTYVHEYLLADNRHYTFYVWSKIFKRHYLVRFLLIPIYWYTICQVYLDLKKKNIFWKIAFAICITVSLVPQKLLEFRYFIIPYLLLRLNMPLPTPLSKMLLEFTVSTFVNAITIYLFVYKTFTWPGVKDAQRFMW
ncbi:putative Dol-P-Glc:Glc(2)Man(9)GlcNAc(2)-PP-Dol alpha-1,2-glucosyltransferase [Octopus sinensis]|uniref:Dol-P-Glc:Glc(2)Man(9)GlcNAc(2)-PP-Dol alpha-1,2-glucosyltransferase n=2 Tax=Octopus TaxID=6643 RepID=A0A6P7SEG3_9MOLL|nr:putative Dol-P-Glc:Glc(2)Man(9)GlcNAc(2)-PP-Dol alpha-1,2-glucosyltransferase [Octopus sinensis]